MYLLGFIDKSSSKTCRQIPHEATLSNHSHTFLHWWHWLLCNVPTCSSGTIWGSSFPGILDVQLCGGERGRSAAAGEREVETAQETSGRWLVASSVNLRLSLSTGHASTTLTSTSCNQTTDLPTEGHSCWGKSVSSSIYTTHGWLNTQRPLKMYWHPFSDCWLLSTSFRQNS